MLSEYGKVKVDLGHTHFICPFSRLRNGDRPAKLQFCRALNLIFHALLVSVPELYSLIHLPWDAHRHAKPLIQLKKKKKSILKLTEKFSSLAAKVHTGLSYTTDRESRDTAEEPGALTDELRIAEQQEVRVSVHVLLLLEA